jgi:pSer/pThr/pTyr-binding forkhead associated (FHA) protein
LKARQNPLNKFEAFMQRLIERPFARLFPSRLEPVEIERRLERALDDNTLLQGEGRRLAPNVYDIYLSIKDHQQLAPGQAMLVRDWQNHLVEYARRHHYTLRTMPIIRLHAESSMGPGEIRVEVEMGDGQGGDGLMATQALSPEQLAQIRAALPQNQFGGSSPQQPPVPQSPTPASSPNHYGPPAGNNPPSMPGVQQTAAVPPARLTIRLPQSGQQVYRIEKPVVNIGRQLSNDIIVEDKRVSRYHAQVKYQPDGNFAIFDLGSTNGITINGIPNMRQHVLRNGDRFTIGSYDFYFERR